MVQNTLRAKDAFLLNLKIIMARRDLKPKDLAELMGVSKQQVSNIFNGEGSVTLNTVEKIATALGVEETDLFDTKLIDSVPTKKD